MPKFGDYAVAGLPLAETDELLIKQTAGTRRLSRANLIADLRRGIERPLVANAWDNEFDSAAELSSFIWMNQNGGVAATAEVIKGALVLREVAANNAEQNKAFVKAKPVSASWSVTTRLTNDALAFGPFNFYGLTLLNNTSGFHIRFVIGYNTGPSIYVQVANLSNPTTVSTQFGQGLTDSPVSPLAPFYMRIRYDNSGTGTFYFDLSRTGIVWTNIGSLASSAIFGNNAASLSHVGLHYLQRAALPAPIVVYDYLRASTDIAL